MKLKSLIKKLMVLGCLVLTLSGCNIMTGNIDSLLKAPQPNNMQKGLAVAIGENIGSNLKYVTPESGSYNKSFILEDLDGDGFDEAILFYLTVDSAGLESFAGICVFSSGEGGQWKLIKSILGTSTKIDYVELRDFTRDGRKEILIGWKQTESLSELCAYDIYSQSDTAIFTDLYNESRLLYDGYHLLILNLYKDSATGKGMAKMCTISGDMLKTVSVCEMYGGYDYVESILYHKIRIDKKVILIDAKLGNSMITQVLMWEDNKLTNPYYDPQTGVNPALIRETDFTCQDIDGDGFIDIPFTTPIPAVGAATGTTDVTTATLTGWASLNLPEENSSSGVLSRKFYCIMNEAHKYYYIVPGQWIGKFSATYNSQDYSLTFYYYEKEETTKMFSLYVTTEENYDQRKDHDTWFELRKSGQKVFAINVAADLPTELGSFMGNMQDNRERLILR